MKLKEIRESRGISQRKAAMDLNLSPVVYGRYENGVREPSNLVLLAMADYFGCSVDEILGREYEPPSGEDEAFEIRERLRRDPAFRLLFDTAKDSPAMDLRAAAAMLKALRQEPLDYYPDEDPDNA